MESPVKVEVFAVIVKLCVDRVLLVPPVGELIELLRVPVHVVLGDVVLPLVVLLDCQLYQPDSFNGESGFCGFPHE